MGISTPISMELETDQLVPSPFNPRKDFKGEAFDELKKSIAADTIHVPLLVRPKGDKYEIVIGERRWRAAKELKIKVPVRVRDLDDKQACEITVTENVQRKDLTPLEEATGLKSMMDLGTKQDDLGKRLGKTQSWVSNRIRLLKAPPSLRNLLQEGRISPQHVVALLPYVEHEVLREEIIASLKDGLENFDKYGEEPVTVEWAKDLADDVVSEQGHDLGLNDYSYEGLKKHFDFSKCESCKALLKVTSEDGKTKGKVCLKKDCFSENIEKAREKLTKVNTEKLSKATVVNTDKMSYRDYVGLENATFDTKVCKDCPDHKLQKPRYAKFGKSRDELEEICLKPSCYRGKTAQVSRVRNAGCREELAFVGESLKLFIESRSAGLTTRELLFILDKVDTSHTPKKGASVKELEGMLIRHAMKVELEPFKYNLNLASLKQQERDWPFEVKRKKPEQPTPKKKVQEKRKKKRVAV